MIMGGVGLRTGFEMGLQQSSERKKDVHETPLLPIDSSMEVEVVAEKRKANDIQDEIGEGNGNDVQDEIGKGNAIEVKNEIGEEKANDVQNEVGKGNANQVKNEIGEGKANDVQIGIGNVDALKQEETSDSGNLKQPDPLPFFGPNTKNVSFLKLLLQAAEQVPKASKDSPIGRMTFDESLDVTNLLRKSVEHYDHLIQQNIQQINMLNTMKRDCIDLMKKLKISNGKTGDGNDAGQFVTKSAAKELLPDGKERNVEVIVKKETVQMSAKVPSSNIQNAGTIRAESGQTNQKVTRRPAPPPPPPPFPRQTLPFATSKDSAIPVSVQQKSSTIDQHPKPITTGNVWIPPFVGSKLDCPVKQAHADQFIKQFKNTVNPIPPTPPPRRILPKVSKVCPTISNKDVPLNPNNESRPSQVGSSKRNAKKPKINNETNPSPATHNQEKVFSSASMQQDQDPLGKNKEPLVCGHCEQTATFLCSACCKRAYCCVECQRNDWNRHSWYCN